MSPGWSCIALRVTLLHRKSRRSWSHVEVAAEPFSSSLQLPPEAGSSSKLHTSVVVALDDFQATDSGLVVAKAANSARLQQGRFAIPRRLVRRHHRGLRNPDPGHAVGNLLE
jgi:hypothetical protein